MNRVLTSALYVTAAITYLYVGRYQTVAGCSVMKVLPLLILSAALIISIGNNSFSSGCSVKLCLAALFFSMLGDVFGELKGEGLLKNAFVLQIASFAVAQIIYAVSFIRFFHKDALPFRSAVKGVLCIILVVYMVCFGIYVLSFIDDPSLRIAVPIYVTLIGIMGLSSVIQSRKWHWLFVTGAFCFICSDSILAWRSFVGPVPQAGLLIMSTYYAAQLLLNISLVKRKE